MPERGTRDARSSADVRFERRCRLRLPAYPAGYRRARGAESIGPLRDTAPAGRSWPDPRDATDVVRAGLRRRLLEASMVELPAVVHVAGPIALGMVGAVCGYLLALAVGHRPAAPLPMAFLAVVLALPVARAVAPLHTYRKVVAVALTAQVLLAVVLAVSRPEVVGGLGQSGMLAAAVVVVGLATLGTRQVAGRSQRLAMVAAVLAGVAGGVLSRLDLVPEAQERGLDFPGVAVGAIMSVVALGDRPHAQALTVQRRDALAFQ